MEDLRDRIIQAYAEFKIEIGISVVREEPQIVLYKVVPGTKHYYKDGTSTNVTIRDITRYIEDVGAAIGARCTISVKDDGIWLEVPRKDRGVVKDLGPRREGMYIPLGMSNGRVVPLDLSDPNTPHLLIAGTTGSGKSVMMNWIISYIIDNYEWDEAALVLVDPKLVEFQAYEEAKNLLWPIANDTAEAVQVIRDLRVVAKDRYAKMKELKIKKHEQTGWGHIILVIDEFAELIMNVPEIQEDIIGIAQIGRACGVHIIMATQSPHREVVTGLIKSNLPAKMVFRVTTTAASMVAMDSSEATKLRGKGDFIFTGHGEQDIRAQAPFITDDEIAEIVSRNLAVNDPAQADYYRPKAKGVSASAGKIEMPGGEFPLGKIVHYIALALFTVVKIAAMIVYYIVYYTAMGIWWFVSAFFEEVFKPAPKKKRRKKSKQFSLFG